MGVEERRAARIGTVSGLALLAGSTAVAAATGPAHSIFAKVLLGLLTLGLVHALVDEIRRQARRRVTAWIRHDTANTVLLGCWAAISLIGTVRSGTLVALVLFLGYAASCAYFVIERRRTIAGLRTAVRHRS